MKTLVTGAGGWLGSTLVEELLLKNYFVRALTFKDSDKLHRLKETYGEKLEIIKSDITAEENLDEKLEGIDVVYHLAAKVHSLPKSKVDEEEFFKVNTYGSEKIFRAAISKKVKRFIFYSTVAVYGTSQDCIDTTYPYNPETPYAKSKAEAEKIALKLFKYEGFPITIIQPVTVYGGEDRGNFAKLKKLADKGFCVQFGDGNNKKTVIYYKDLIRGTIKIAEEERFIGERVIAGTEVLAIKNINDVLKNNKMKVRTLVINKFITNLILKCLHISNNSLLKKIYRNIFSLYRNNEYQIDKFILLSIDHTLFRVSYFD